MKGLPEDRSDSSPDAVSCAKGMSHGTACLAHPKYRRRRDFRIVFVRERSLSGSGGQGTAVIITILTFCGSPLFGTLSAHCARLDPSNVAIRRPWQADAGSAHRLMKVVAGAVGPTVNSWF